MKCLGIFVLLACVVYASSQACSSASDCITGMECCLKPDGQRDPGRCSPLLPRNARCRINSRVVDGAYLYDCPCEEGLNCNRRRGRCQVLQSPTRPPSTTDDTTVEE